MDRLTRLERKKNEAEARFRKAQKETKEQERKVRTRCLVLLGSALSSAIKREKPGTDEHLRLLQILAENLGPEDTDYIAKNERFI